MNLFQKFKIIVALVIYVTISGSSLQAQETEESVSPSNIRIGIRAGINLTSMSASPNPYTKIKGRSRVIGGASIEIPLWSRFFLQPELLYAWEHGYSYNSIGDAAYGSVYLSYIEIPILFKAKFLLKSPLKPYIFWGPSLGFRTSAKSHDNIKTGSSYTSLNPDIRSSTNAFNFALTVGGGAEFAVLPWLHVFADARYLFGLSNISKSSTSTLSINAAYLMSGVSFSL